MSQYRNLASRGFVLFLAATQAGCAGSGLKNIFTRNETDGYHSIDELEAEERKLAETEESGEEESPSIAARMASWRPFGKPDASEKEEEEYAAYDSGTSDADSEKDAKASNPFSRAFAKRDSIDPDPFLESDFGSTKRPTTPAFNAAPNRELAKLDEKSTAAKKQDKPVDAEHEFAMTSEPKAKSNKETKVASTKSPTKPDTTDAEDSDALAKRFEQHFLLNSAGTVSKTDAEESVEGTAKTLQKKAATIAASADSKQRDVSSLAEKQIDAFDHLLGSDSTNSDEVFASKKSSAAEPLKAARRRNIVDKTAENSLAAFDSLVGTETNNSRHPVIEAAHTITQETQNKSAALDINVADAEALFGAAEARQNSLATSHATTRNTRTSDKDISDNEFHWNETQSPKSDFESGIAKTETAGSAVRRLQSNASGDRELFHNTAFGAPPATAGNLEGDDCSVVESAENQVSVKTAFASRNRDVTSRKTNHRSNVVILPAAVASSQDGDVHFTAAPVAPVPELESTDRVAATASRPGLIQSLSVRNWMLLLGGLVVIALLFAPSRTKSATVTGRTANG